MSFYQSQPSSQGPIGPIKSMAQYQQLIAGYGNEANGTTTHHTPLKSHQIYTAAYSGVAVYEMMINGIEVMRRRQDSWLNATQILKVAGVEKGKRTKVLEKEILTGHHEKVQGGYGKYQGTWVDYERGVALCRQYQVEDLLRPLLQYDMGQNGVSLAGQGTMETPTKEQAMAAQRKRLYAGVNENHAPSQMSNGTFFKNISSTASNAVAAISKARFDPASQRSGLNQRLNAARRSSQPPRLTGNDSFHGESQQSIQTMASGSNFDGDSVMDSTYGTQNPPRPSQNGEPPRKRARQDTFTESQETVYEPMIGEGSPTEPNQSFLSHGDFTQPQEQGVIALKPLDEPFTERKREKVALLGDLIGSADLNEDISHHEALQTLSGTDLDTPVDHALNTTLHWAASMGYVSLVRALIAGGASIYRVNVEGESPLMRVCGSRNNLDLNSFPEVLELLAPTIEMKDKRRRTVLHKIALASAMKGRAAASKYYLEALLEFVVRQGSANNSQQNSFVVGSAGSVRPMGLTRFIHEMVNAQDDKGDTPLYIAARTGSRSLVEQLREVGADPTIKNCAGLSAVEFGVEPDNDLEEKGGNQQDGGEGRSAIHLLGGMKQELSSFMSGSFSELQNLHELQVREQQAYFDRQRAEMKRLCGEREKKRKELDVAKEQAQQRALRKQKIHSLKKAISKKRMELNTRGIKIWDPPMMGEAIPDGALLAGMETMLIDDDDSSSHHTQPPTSAVVLRSWIHTLHELNEKKAKRLVELRSRDCNHEYTAKRIVSLCTGVDEARLDDAAPRLTVALESDRVNLMNLDKLRGFLRDMEDI
ncbi:MAG: transcriptional regulator swi6 [Peltula sp. TS41687]|nr:MAG: transcriptional regulator swi6 [Peltula sp. TS41687]